MTINNDEETKFKANPGYAASQLAKALDRLQRDVSKEDRDLAANKIRKWTDVLIGMSEGFLSVGSRAPVQGTPTWVTLEVVHGGFATRNFLAAGALSSFESERLDQIGYSQAVSPRYALNLSFLSENGLRELLSMLDSGRFRVVVPEQSALLVIALLTSLDWAQEAYQLLSVIEPWMDRLRFYPEPSETPFPHTATVHLESVGQVARRLGEWKQTLES